MQQTHATPANSAPVEHSHGPLREALRRALRAPSSHNSQPWLLRLSDGVLELRADESRRLEVVDAHGRELVISCGAALFSLRCALEHSGCTASLHTFPDPSDSTLLARIYYQGRSEPSRDPQLFEALERRQTHRDAFLPESLPEGTIETLRAAAQDQGSRLVAFTEDAARSELAALVAEGDRLQWHDPRFRRELASWMRPNASRRGDGLAGYTIGLGSVLSQLAPWVVRHFDTGASQARTNRRLVLDAPLLMVLATDGDERADWLAAGQALQHMLLRAAAQGLSAGFMNQPLQCPSLRPRLDRMLGQPCHSQLLLRVGRARLGRASQRRPWAEVVAQ